MTDSIAQIEEHLKKLKERDGIKTLVIEHHDVDGWMPGCTVRLWDVTNECTANDKNFSLAYTKALKRLRGKNDTDGKS